MGEDFDNHRRIFDACPERVEGAAMIFKLPPQFEQWSMSISKTRLSSLAQLTRGGVLDGAEAETLRRLLAEHGQGRVPSERGPVRGLSRLLRRNPTEAERALWDALTKDRRFAGAGFKRQTPVGPHIADVVSFPLRLVVDLVPSEESEEAMRSRNEKRAWLSERGYRIVEVQAKDVETDAKPVLDRLAAEIR